MKSRNKDSDGPISATPGKRSWDYRMRQIDPFIYLIFSQVYKVIPVLPPFFPSFHSVPEDYTVLLRVRKFPPSRLSPSEATSWYWLKLSATYTNIFSCLWPYIQKTDSFKNNQLAASFPHFSPAGFSSFSLPGRSPLYPLVLPSKPFSMLCPPPQPCVDDYFSVSTKLEPFSEVYISLP